MKGEQEKVPTSVSVILSSTLRVIQCTEHHILHSYVSVFNEIKTSLQCWTGVRVFQPSAKYVVHCDMYEARLRLINEPPQVLFFCHFLPSDHSD